MINDANRNIPRSHQDLGPLTPWRFNPEAKEKTVFTPPPDRTTSPSVKKELETAILQSGLKNGMRISFHHHLRLGDRVVEQVLIQLKKMGYRDLILCLSSVMGSAAEAVYKAVKTGVVRRIETTGLKPPLSRALLRGEIPEPVVFRSHGGRARAIEQGEIPIDVAFIAASAADREGNLNGTEGSNRFGSLGYALADARNASHVIGITDYLKEESLEHKAIGGERIDQLVIIDSIGNKTGMAGGSIRNAGRPIEKRIARKALDVLLSTGSVKPGFSYQAGSGGISLMVSRYLKEYMKEHSLKGSFASGGVTNDLVDMLQDGLFRKLWDVQSFDDQAALSLGANKNHKEMSASLYANPDHPDCIAHRLDAMILSATEIDRDFHVNSITGTDGRILGALGGAPDTAEGAKNTIVVMPSMRGRIPTVNNKVRTVCTPGQTVDILVTERGISVNPRREDLIRRLTKSGIPLLKMDELIRIVHSLTGTPDYPAEGTRVGGIVEYRDGSVLDCLWI